MGIQVQPYVVLGALASAILVAACAGGLGPPDAQDSEEGAGIPASATPQMERGPRDFKVSEDAAQVVNPVQADETSLQRGWLYSKVPVPSAMAKKDEGMAQRRLFTIRPRWTTGALRWLA